MRRRTAMGAAVAGLLAIASAIGAVLSALLIIIVPLLLVVIVVLGSGTIDTLVQNVAYLDTAGIQVTAGGTASYMPSQWLSTMEDIAIVACPKGAFVSPSMGYVLMAIWKIETSFDGSQSKQIDANGTLLPAFHEKSSAGALGPMQFEPSTFKEYELAVQKNIDTMQNMYQPTYKRIYTSMQQVKPKDRIWNLYWSFDAATNMLCENANNFGSSPGTPLPDQAQVIGDWFNALGAYNHSTGYALGVLAQAMLWSKQLPVTIPDFVFSQNGALANPNLGDLFMAKADLTVMDEALANLGQPTHNLCAPSDPQGPGGQTPLTGMDSSGYAAMLYADAGVSPLKCTKAGGPVAPWQLYDVTQACRMIGGDGGYMDKVRFPGDLVFFASAAADSGPSASNVSAIINHVGILLGPGAHKHAGQYAVIDEPGDPVGRGTSQGYDALTVEWLKPSITGDGGLINSRFFDPYEPPSPPQGTTEVVVAYTNPAEYVGGGCTPAGGS